MNHDIIEGLEILDKELIEIKKNLNRQFHSSDSSIQELHNNIVRLSSKYPEQSEMLEFIVFINDKIEINNSDTKDILLDTINQMIDKKSILIRGIISDYRSQNTPKSKIIKSFDDLKYILLFILFMSIILGFILYPKEFVGVVKESVKISKGE